jgi:TPR repeat protein
LRDYETAAHFYELAADQGNAAAQVGLGCLYEEGHGVTQDYTKARHFMSLQQSKVMPELKPILAISIEKVLA